ncbi:hypothetical protein CRN80_22105 [Pseudomonas sp. FDAARGOS_380]|nr:hypothetical protein CRN80_22105 [Pseudomonas sp. FDAARGOS_380]
MGGGCFAQDSQRCLTSCQPTPIHLTPHDPTVGAGLPAMTASQPTPIYLTPHNPTVWACSRRRTDSQHSWMVYISIAAVTAP